MRSCARGSPGMKCLRRSRSSRANRPGLFPTGRGGDIPMFARKLLFAVPSVVGIVALSAAQGPLPEVHFKELQPPNQVLGPCPQGATSMLIDLDGSFSVVTM